MISRADGVVVGVGLPDVITEGLTSLLCGHTQFVKLSDRELCGEVIGEIAAGRPHMVISDPFEQTENSDRAFDHIGRCARFTNLLVFTNNDARRDIRRAFESGAVGYLFKSASRDEILMSVDGAMCGKVPPTPAVATALVDQLRDPTAHPALSAREYEMLVLVSRGLTNREISQRKHISEGTVKTYLNRIAVKLQSKNRTDSVRCAIEMGILNPESQPGHPTD